MSSMSLTDNIDDILFATAFEVDKIYDEIFSGSFSVSASSFSPFTGNVVTNTTVHTYGSNVLPVMQFSIDGSTWYDAGTMIYDTGSSLRSKFSASCYATSTLLVIIGQNFSSGSLTCSYRAILIAET